MSIEDAHTQITESCATHNKYCATEIVATFPALSKIQKNTNLLAHLIYLITQKTLIRHIKKV